VAAQTTVKSAVAELPMCASPPITTAAPWQSPVADDAGTPLVIPYTKGEREQTKELGTARK
jgi:hypothetical protein